MDGLRLAARRAGPTLAITVIGDLDVATKPDLVAFLTKALQDNDECVSLDLSGLTFIDAGGIGLLVGLRNRTRRQGTDLILINSPACVERLLFLTGLDKRFTPA
jgi:anti-sigma B factor antagonist